MINSDKKIKGSDILVLGLTFKENCPDFRNTKVVDIIDDLLDFKCNVDIYDPWINKDEVQTIYKNYNIINNPFKSSKKYSAIIVAVAHKQFVKLKQKDFENISLDNPILIDIKGIVKNPTWRL